jgi:LysR family tcuABC transcriptional regulator
MLELQHLRSFVRLVELGNFGDAARDLHLPESALSERLTELEDHLSACLLERLGDGVVPTEQGLAFFREAQAALRHVEQAERSIKESRLAGTVSVGLTPTACSVLGLPLMLEVRKRYPETRLQIVESLSGHLAAMLNARQLDLAVLYGSHTARHWRMTPLLEERMFLVQSARLPTMTPLPSKVRLADLKQVPLILPTQSHNLRITLDAALNRARVQPVIAAEIDSLATLMDAVDAGLGATIQPWAATRRYPDATDRFQLAEIADGEAMRTSFLCSLSHEDLSPAAHATRVVLSFRARELVRSGAWLGARISDHHGSPIDRAMAEA